MNSAAQALVGEQDFTSFRAAGCQSSTPNRNVHKIVVSAHRDFVLVDIEANAFLQHMVRNIVGSLLVIGRGLKPVTWIRDLLELRNRCEAAMTAAPHGLYLVQVIYPAAYGLPAGAKTAFCCFRFTLVCIELHSAGVMSVSNTWIKMCGLKQRAEIEIAVELGVDAVGLVFYAPSVRSYWYKRN